MGSLADFANGFLMMIVIIWVFNTITFFALAWTWAGMFFLLILLIPMSIIVYEFLKFRGRKQKTDRVSILKQILIALYGACFASWIFDVGSTYYAIDILGAAKEQNPLGWPLGSLGALVFYIPALTFTYFLLVKVKHKYALLVSIILTSLTSYLGIMNLLAGISNFGFFVSSVPPYLEVYRYLLCIVIVVDSVYAIVFIKLTKLALPRWFRAKPNLSTVAIVLSSIALILSLAQPTYNFFISIQKRESKPSFELSNFYMTHTYTCIEVHNNGTATANDIILTLSFSRPVNANSTYRPYEWITTMPVREIREGSTATVFVPVGSYQLESTYPGTKATDYEAFVDLSGAYEGSGFHNTFHLEHFEVLPPPGA